MAAGGSAGGRSAARVSGSGGVMTAKQYEATLNPFQKMVFHASRGVASEQEINSLKGFATNPTTPKAEQRDAFAALRLAGRANDGADFFKAQDRFYAKKAG